MEGGRNNENTIIETGLLFPHRDNKKGGSWNFAGHGLVPRAELIDITRPEARTTPLQVFEDLLLILAVPVYMGRVPSLLTDWFQTIAAEKTPAVCVVVYGNRAYDDALLELKDIVMARGCTPIACAAYIGEHSFSSPDAPTAHGRPDSRDLTHAESFGQKIGRTLQRIPSVDHISDIIVPGNFPYGGVTRLWDVDFIAVGNGCTQCGICAEVCPAGAVDPQKSEQINIEKCITCCACIKSCPQDARSMKTGPVKDAAMRLNKLYHERKDPELFLAE